MFRNSTILIFLVVFIFTTVGCKKILLMSYGVKKPKVENANSLGKFIKKNKWNDIPQYTFTFESYVKHINDIGIPDVRVFNRDGRYLPYPGEEQCKGGSNEFIEILKYSLEFPTTDSIQLDSIKNGYRNLEGERIDRTIMDDADFTLVIYWAKFAGKVNDRDINEWLENVSKNKNASFDVVMVNCDLQEWWREENLKALNMN